MQTRAAEELKRLVTERLTAARLDFAAARAYVTPRRLVLIVKGLPKAQPDVTVEKKGPRIGSPPQAIEGFLRAAGVERIEQCEQRDSGKGVFYYAVSHEKGRPSEEALAVLLPEALGALLWPKSMRWGRHKLRWVRPVHSILCLFDEHVVRFDFAHLSAGDSTCGHRHLAPERVIVKNIADYKIKLKAAYVELDAARRAETIRLALERLANGEGLRVRPDEALIAENAGLVEHPVVLMGTIDAAFMDVPPEVLTTAMRTHQKYFALETANGALAPRFALVSNMATADGGKAIIAGNERVLRARLSDAKFFWDQDRAHTLKSRIPRLKKIVFHAALGTVYEKVHRMHKLAENLAPHVPEAKLKRAQRAVLRCKADLVTNMVGEFPELQGVMGAYYARHDGESEAVARAIAEHYSPLGPSDRCPRKPTGIIVSLADKIDTLVGFFLIGETPTGSKDPYALRRAALGVIRLILENNLRLSLLNIFKSALVMHDQGFRSRAEAAFQEDASADRKRSFLTYASMPSDEQLNSLQPVLNQLLEFFTDRLKVYMRDKGIGHDLINAVFAGHVDDDLFRLTAKANRLATFLQSDDGANLLIAYRRASNIVRAEEKKGWKSDGIPVDRSVFRAPEEHTLNDALGRVRTVDLGMIEAAMFDGYLMDLASLRRPLDEFFEKVTVNAEEAGLRDNRLKFMQAIRAKMDAVADFSKLEG